MANNAMIQRVVNYFGGDNETKDKVLTEGLVEARKGFDDEKNPKTISEEQLTSIFADWDKTYSMYYDNNIKKRQGLCINYYQGVQGQYVIGQQDRFSSDNIIFEATETYIPQATRKNPEPVVSSKKFEIVDIDPTTGEQIVADTVDMAKSLTIALNDVADNDGLLSEGKQVVRDWLQKQIGAFMVTYDNDTNKPHIESMDPLRIEMDANGYVDNKGCFHGLYVKLLCTSTVEELMEEYPKHDKYILETGKGQLGSTITYSKYYTEKTIFVRLNKVILDIIDNPYYVEDENRKFVDSPFNFVFLTMFNDKKQPHDNTGLIWQCIPIQDKLNKINEQIFKNMEQANASIRFDPKMKMTADKAVATMRALRDGQSYVIAEQGAFERITPPVLGAEIYNLRNDLRNEIKSIYGIFGSTAQGIGQEKTVGGKVITRELDQSRIGGGITYQMEQVYDTVFNWCVQIMANMMTDQTFIYEGEVTTFSGQNISKPVTISVKENSLIPRDPINDAQLAKEMFQMGAIDRQTLLEMVNFPNVQEVINRQPPMAEAMPAPVQ